MTTAYALRMRHTKTVTKVFPRHSLPKSTHQKKIQLFVFRNVDRSHGKETVAGVGGGKRDRNMEEVENEEEDVKPDISSLIPPLPDSMASLDLSSSIKKEGVDPYSKVVPWKGEPIEEDDDLDYLEDEEHNESVVSGDSDYDPGDVSDASTESISSGNSSGSSYTPNKCRGKGTRTREGLVGRKLSRTRSSQEASAPNRQPDTGEATKFCHSDREQQNLQPSFQTSVQLNASAPSKPALDDHKALSRPFLKPSRMYACDFCREVFPEQVTYRRHHCPLRTSAATTAVAAWGTPASIPMTFTTTTTTQPTVAPNPVLMTTMSNSLVSTTGPITGSNSGLMKVPCTIQGNSTLVSPLSVASAPSFTLPSIMLPSPTPSVQSGSRPIMATVVFNSPSGRVSRLVLQTQGLTFPTQTLSQTSPIRLSVPTQANTLNPTQASPSMQLTNLLLGGLIQPQTLLNSPHLTRPSAPSPVPASALTPTPASSLAPASAPVPAHIPASAPVTGPAPVPKTAPAPMPASFSVSPSTPLPASFPVPAQNSSRAAEPLKIVGLFVNRSQELALQQRLKKSWRAKGIFLCRQCGAISRQPSLCVRHRYLHRGSRQHRCDCGRTFQRQLHLLRHHVQHAEATRFVCTPCGQTFSGARCLARHKQGQERKRKRKRRVRPRKDCHAPFSCDCGQVFQRPAAFLWHKLKNPKRQGGLKHTQRNCSVSSAPSQIKTSSL
ncbi:hypothetical protein AAFF_G00126710 [Aldrovandia affinis]|uniref:C2H2-type domain-containing protein n=1 Tax=Aldrovandia affinis TaxID=143900 RepID=A0AAD7RRH6_9TELE|nr:hypothetical protein AAFF_G00126710 [Aldrovandia affinis]